MKIEKAGKLHAIKIFFDKNDNVVTKVAVEFKNGIFVYKLQLNDYRVGFIVDLINNYDIGISEDSVLFDYIDLENVVRLHCSVFRSEYILPEFIASFENSRKNIILSLFKGIEAISLYSDSFELENGFAPFTKGDFSDEVETEKQELHSMIEKQEISLEENMVVCYNDDWSNEGYYGPQNEGGFSRLDNMFRNSGFEDYDYTLFDTEEINNCKWDENTSIFLKGSPWGDLEAIEIETCLKKIKWLKNISLNTLFSSGLQHDIKNLCEVSYNTHEQKLNQFACSSLYLMSVEEILNHMQEFEDFLQARYENIKRTSREVNSV